MAERAQPQNSAQNQPHKQQNGQAGLSNGHTPMWEWAVGTVGLLFLLGILSFLVYEATQPVTPPLLTVAAEQVIETEGGYLVQIRVTNTGESTAGAVDVEGTLKASDDPQAQPVETSQFTFDFVPSQSTRRGGLFFKENPAQYVLEVQAKGYAEP